MWAQILEENIGSQRMCEKCGYKKEGILRKAVYKNGRFRNQFVMSVLRKDFDNIMKKYIILLSVCQKRVKLKI